MAGDEANLQFPTCHWRLIEDVVRFEAKTRRAEMVEIVEQRKLASILAADVVGYSKMMGRDEEGTLKTLRVYREIFDLYAQKRGGRIFNTAGDAIMVDFGSAVEAVRCAVAIQEEIANRNSAVAVENQMWFRIGINVGDVIIEGSDLIGDGVNIAARLEGVAEKGGICISASTFEQIKNKLSVAFDDVGPQKLKNIEESVSAFRIIPGEVSFGTSKSSTQTWIKWLSAVCTAAVFAALAVYFLLPKEAYPRYPYDGRWIVTVDQRTGCYDNETKVYPVMVIEGKINEPSHRVPKKGVVNNNGYFQIELIGKDNETISSVEGVIKGNTGRGRMTGGSNKCTGDVIVRRSK